MPIYLSRYIGSGTLTDPCRPVGSDQPGWSAIDLRADGGATRDGNGLNACLLSLPLPDADPRLYQLASAKGEKLPLLVRAGLAARLNATIAYTRLDDLIAELLLRPPGNAWKPLRDRADRQLAIYLDGLLSPSPALRTLAAKIYEETWSTADNASLTSDLTWTEFLGSNWSISGNRARLAGNVGANYARADHDTDTDDQIVSAVLTTLTYGGANDYFHLFCRKDGTATETFYALSALRDLTPRREWNIYKTVATAYTIIATDTTDPASGDLMEISAVDSTIQGRVNALVVLGPVTDTAITGNTRAGIGAYIDGAGSVVELDGWKVRDYATGVPFTMRQSTLRGGDVLRGVELVASGLSATVNQATETDLAQVIANSPKRRLVTQVTETGLSQTVARRKLKALGQPSEVDLAQALAQLKRKAIGQVLETDLAQSIAKLKRKALSQSSETDLAQAVTRKKICTVGQAIETDLAQALTKLKRKALGQPAETDTAQALTRRKARFLGQTVETDLAQPITRVGVAYPVGQVVETDLAQTVAVNPRRRLVGQAVESNAAQTVARLKRKTLGQASEGDSAQPVAARKLRILNLAGETDLAQPLSVQKIRGVALVSETDLAQPITSRKLKTIGQAQETDTALSVTYGTFLVGYIRIVNLSGRLPTGRAIVGRLPGAVSVRGRQSTVEALTGSLASVEALFGTVPTAADVRGVL